MIEHSASKRLSDPVVLTISEPGENIYTADAATIQAGDRPDDAAALRVLVDVGKSPAEF